MKLQAVTICINYADYLEGIAGNRGHFDRWVVVTVAGDAATQVVGVRHGLEVVLSATLQSDGKDFNAADNKAAAVNEGLARLDDEGWVLVLDADVLLPRDFRARLAALPLEPGCLYGAAGRRVCEDRETYTMLRECEPWDRLAGRNSQALGYFNLFYLGTLPNRYIPAARPGSGAHDDYRFTSAFPPAARRQVPMTVIHAGPTHTNWAQRRSPEFAAGELGSGFAALVERVAREAGGGTVGMVGYFPGGRWRAVAERFRTALLVDHHAVHTPSGDPLVEADRAVLRARWAAEAAGLPGVRRLGPHSAASLAQIADGSLDALYLPGEVAPAWLVAALPHWLAKLRPGGIVFGDLYGLPHWREATFTISLLLAAPEETDGSGAWWKRLHEKPPLAVVPASRHTERPDAEREGVVLVNSGKESLEALLLAAHAVREHWAGAVRIYHWGEEDGSLAIACARLGIGLWVVGEESAPLEERVAEVVAVQPYRRALVLRAGMLPVQPLAEVFGAEQKWARRDELSRVPEVGAQEGLGVQARERLGSAQERVPPGVLVEGGKVGAVAAVTAQEFSGEGAAVVTFAGAPETWSEAAWEVWSLREAALAGEMAGEVRVAAGATVVTFVDAESAGDFQRASLTWKFPPGTPVLVGLIGLAAEELWLPGATPAMRLAPLTRAQADDLPGLLRWLAAECGTEGVIFLPAAAAALPGAELWPGVPWAEAPVVVEGSKATQEEWKATGNRFIPEPFCGRLDRARLAELAGRESLAGRTLRELPLVMEEVFGAAVADWSAPGWRRPPTHLYVPASERVRRAGDTRVTARRERSGQWLLADDVVVISLPERTDRRAQVRAALERDGVKFRFVDGVRLTDEDLDPVEVSEVHLHTFKLIGGAAKFLRGTAGCRRAHLRCLEEAHAREVRSLLLLEDDAQFYDGWIARYAAALEELPRGWLQLYLSSSNFRPAEPWSTHLHRLGGAYQTTAILYSEAGIEAALQALRRSRYEVDAWLGNHLHPFGGSYVVMPNLTFQKGGVSDIMSVDRGVTP